MTNCTETVDELIDQLEEYRKDLGGDTPVKIEYRSVFPAVKRNPHGDRYVEL